MWLLGHMALGYFSGVTVNRFTKERVFIPLLWVSALLPDLDELFRGYLIHRGPTHSIIVAIAIFLPIYILTKKGLPYFSALASHSLIGDFFEPPLMLFWPLSNYEFSAPAFLQINGVMIIIVEMSLFLLMLFFMNKNMVKNKDFSWSSLLYIG